MPEIQSIFLLLWRWLVMLGCEPAVGRFSGLRTADEPAGDEDQQATDDYLKGRLQERRVHVAVANKTDNPKLYDHYGNRHGDGQAANQQRLNLFRGQPQLCSKVFHLNPHLPFDRRLH